MADILFILKNRQLQDTDPSAWNFVYGGGGISSGLFNSVSFIVEMLKKENYKVEMVQVVDNNSIDREVTKHKPKLVIIEALWVVPEKFELLRKLHPKVTWLIRLHSEVPFLAGEGMAMKWIGNYIKQPRVYVALNSLRALRDLRALFPEKARKFKYAPNYYPTDTVSVPDNTSFADINISCFGAIRPLKNQLAQAIAAINFANRFGLKLNFHINSSRREGQGESVLKNLENLFKHSHPHQLVCHDWQNHKEFLKLVSRMDIGMQVSFTETYNIVAADHIVCGVPIVVSDEITFVNPMARANPTDLLDIENKLIYAYRLPSIHRKLNSLLLKHNSREAKRVWKKLLPL